ncbi:bucentaur or craniofacial development-domain-containing protein [Gongronella butleri]|nr:bucentaur or craniofacial development-domain-containing protein [Gongronella butleri]
MSSLSKLTNDDPYTSDEEDDDFVPEDVSDDDDHHVDDAASDHDDSKEEACRSKSTEKAAETVQDKSSSSERRARVDALWSELQQPQAPVKRKAAATEAQETPSPSNSASSTPASSSASTPPTHTASPDTAASSKRPKVVRPKSTLSALASQYNIKVPKMNTLDKSRLDWQSFVDREGIKDDLKYTNKDGYLEKVAFLNRVDDRRITALKQGQRDAKKQSSSSTPSSSS